MEGTEAIVATDPSGCRHRVQAALNNGDVVLEVGLLVSLADGRRASETWRVALTSAAVTESLYFDGTSGEAGASLQLLSTSEVTTPDRQARSLTMMLVPPRPGEYALESIWEGGTASLGFTLEDSGRVSAGHGS
jgi:hypothetical protein